MAQSSALALPESLLFLRHARTPWNIDGLTMGQSDIELSNIGLREAEQALAALQTHPVDVIVSSPLTRCLMTISPFRAVGDHAIVIEPRFAERSWGVYEGIPKSQRWGEANPKGGETDGEFRFRVTEGLKALPTEGHTLLVSHSGVFRGICKLGYIHRLPHTSPPHAIPVLLERSI